MITLAAPRRSSWMPAPRGGWSFLLGAAVMGAAAFLAMAVPLSAGKQLPHRWAVTEMGYSSDADLAGYTSTAMGLWSQSSGLRPYSGGSQIRVVFGPLVPPVYHDHQSAQANLSFDGSNIASCEVRVDPAQFLALNDFGRQNVITHEIGHCFGLDHSDVPGVMMNPRFYSFSTDDAQTIHDMYPPPGGAAAVTAAAPEAPPAPAAQPQLAANELPAPAAATDQGGGAVAASAGPVTELVPERVESGNWVTSSIGVEARAYAGILGPGWSFIVWTGLEADPVTCGCEQVARYEGSTWMHWRRTPPAGLPNTLESLTPGTSYWVYRQ